jgi:DNA polymerase
MTHPPFDFETYSEAGYVWQEDKQKWRGPDGASGTKRGLPVIGAACYSEHDTTEVLVLNYDLNDGRGVRRWYPGWANPQDLFDHLTRGGTLEAHNLPFERWIWKNVCVRRYGWPDLEQYEPQLFCSMAKCRAYSYPPSLGQAAAIAGVDEQKDKAGAALMKKFSMPQNPTKANGFKKRFTYADDPESYMAYTQGYGGQDVIAEHALSQVVPEMIPIQREYYRLDQRINRRGVHVDRMAVDGAISIIEQAFAKYDAELQQMTGGIKSTELQKLKGWCAGRGYPMSAMDEEAINAALKDPTIPADVARVLTLRQAIGSASVKKVFAIRNQVTRAGRLVDLFVFHGARTGRPTGSGPQPTNLPKAGPDVWKCVCGKHYHHSKTSCPWCASPLRVDHKGVPFAPGNGKPREWNPEAAEDAFSLVYFGDLELLERHFGGAMLTLAGCMRGMFDAAPGHDLVSSDFTAIEAVVLACLAGEQWRIDLFRNKGKIYEASGAKVVGLSYDELLQFAKDNGKHHPARQIGKTAELGLGFQGWIGAWKAFDSSGSRDDDEIKKIILAWREASPAIVEFWGGQTRRLGYYGGNVPELFGVEGHFIWAAMNPDTAPTEYAGLKFHSESYYLRTPERIAFESTGEPVFNEQTGEWEESGEKRKVVYPAIDRPAVRVFITLPSGRQLTYHDVTTWPNPDKPWSPLGITYWGYNTNPKNGPPGWIAIDTWGGRLVENIVQATANDILRFASTTLEDAGYPIVLHVYDEIVSEVPQGFGSIKEFEALMMRLPEWAKTPDGQPWPIFVDGGWRASRYRKG